MERSNQLPIGRTDINALGQVQGLDAALEVAGMVEFYRTNGGMNPNSAQLARTDDGVLDEGQILCMLRNYKAWRS